MKEELYKKPVKAFMAWLKERQGRKGIIMLATPDDEGFVAQAQIDTMDFSHMLFCLMKENKPLAMQICSTAALFANTHLTKSECEEVKIYAKQLTHDYLHGAVEASKTSKNLN